MSWENVWALDAVTTEARAEAGPYPFSVAMLGKEAGSEKLGFSLWSLSPGAFNCPYHYHHREEELFVILSGKGILRQAGQYREVLAGQAVFFKTGEDGVHQLYNHGDQPLRYLTVSNKHEADVCEYPDSDKVLLRGAHRQLYLRSTKVEYMDGEGDPKRHWSADALEGKV